MARVVTAALAWVTQAEEGEHKGKKAGRCEGGFMMTEAQTQNHTWGFKALTCVDASFAEKDSWHALLCGDVADYLPVVGTQLERGADGDFPSERCRQQSCARREKAR